MEPRRDDDGGRFLPLLLALYAGPRPLRIATGPAQNPGEGDLGREGPLLEFRVYWAWLGQRSLFDRGVYGSWRAVDVGFEPLVMRRRRSRAGLSHEQGPFSCGLRARGGKPGYRGTGGQARP